MRSEERAGAKVKVFTFRKAKEQAGLFQHLKDVLFAKKHSSSHGWETKPTATGTLAAEEGEADTLLDKASSAATGSPVPTEPRNGSLQYPA